MQAEEIMRSDHKRGIFFFPGRIIRISSTLGRDDERKAGFILHPGEDIVDDRAPGAVNMIENQKLLLQFRIE